MQQSQSTSKQSSLLASPTEDENAVTEILLALRKLISPSQYLTDFNWGCKRRRSCLDQIQGGAATASPTTPLSFSPTESDQKSKHNSKKRLREDNIERLTRTRDVLRREVENAKKHYDKLNAYNSELKAMKKEVINNFPRKEETQVEISGRVNIGADLTQNYRISMAPHQQPLITTVQQIFQYPIGQIQTRLYSSNDGAPSADQAGPLGIDLNFPAIEAYEEPFDASKAIADQRARFAEARRQRRGLMKAKSMRNNANEIKAGSSILTYKRERGTAGSGQTWYPDLFLGDKWDHLYQAWSYFLGGTIGVVCGKKIRKLHMALDGLRRNLVGELGGTPSSATPWGMPRSTGPSTTRPEGAEPSVVTGSGTVPPPSDGPTPTNGGSLIENFLRQLSELIGKAVDVAVEKKFAEISAPPSNTPPARTVPLAETEPLRGQRTDRTPLQDK
ncbi:hypothetical protein PHJA_002424300 [Phtheirospermum japonicum]|uniref:Uncharacterized protein n=1 Tax=Phtheirospermum japonicum TaxID=374723 RepID=A0A830D3J6_9LAMI|nr:hypothetical protein PHJA_002424300 [Phtheirospermum japonicum]